MTDSTHIGKLLSKLEQVKGKGDQWIARCPAHDDRTPSLSIKETGDGTILLKCWAGCGAADVVHAVGLELKDLFPPSNDHRLSRKPYAQRLHIEYRDLLRMMSKDLDMVCLCAGDLIRGDFKKSGMPTLVNAANRLRRMLEAANV